MSEIIDNINRYLGAAEKIRPYTSSNSGFGLDLEKLSPDDLECILLWFKDGGSLFHKIQSSFFRGGDSYHSYWIEKSGVILYVKATTIAKYRPKKGFSGVAELVAQQIISQCDRERIEKAKQKGHKYFYEDGSLLKHAIEVMGEPKEK